MKDFLADSRRRLADILMPALNDLGAVFLGVSVVFFTRAFPSVYLDDINLWMLMASVATCLTGLVVRAYYRGGGD